MGGNRVGDPGTFRCVIFDTKVVDLDVTESQSTATDKQRPEARRAKIRGDRSSETPGALFAVAQSSWYDSPTTPLAGFTDSPSVNVWVETEASAEFARLRLRLLRFVVPATAAFLAWFIGYVALGAWAPELMGRMVVGEVTLVLILSVGQFVSTFALTAAYARYATQRLDPLADHIRQRLEGGPA